MIFNSITFLSFFIVFSIFYWISSRQIRLWLIFISSLVFYGFWRFDFIPLLLVSVVIDYFCARIIEKDRSSKKKKIFLCISVAANISLLVFFKYLYFLAESISGVASFFALGEVSVPYTIVLPLGISFYTFQSMSYTIDVYRGRISAQRDFLLFANYVIFFPQLVAGPILRAGEVIWQLDKRPSFDPRFIAEGIKRILSGLFLKVVLADNIASFVDEGFSFEPNGLSTIDVWVLAILFGHQIYFDFAGYSHIALGCAQVLGIRFPENFKFPYFSISPKEFWRRWHISLSSWVRDYLYAPLCRVSAHSTSVGGMENLASGNENLRRHLALVVTWLIMGLWHGAAWTFVMWGGIHALAVLAYRLIFSRIAWPKFITILGGLLLTQLVVMWAWIPFRAATVHDALVLMGTAFNPTKLFAAGSYTPLLTLPREGYLIVAFLVIGGSFAYGMFVWGKKLAHRLPWLFVTVEFGAVTAMTALVFIYLRPIRQFIYFQF